MPPLSSIGHILRQIALALIGGGLIWFVVWWQLERGKPAHERSRYGCITLLAGLSLLLIVWFGMGLVELIRVHTHSFPPVCGILFILFGVPILYYALAEATGLTPMFEDDYIVDSSCARFFRFAVIAAAVLGAFLLTGLDDLALGWLSAAWAALHRWVGR